MGWTLQQSVKANESNRVISALMGEWQTREEAVIAAQEHYYGDYVLRHVVREYEKLPSGDMWLTDPNGDRCRLLLNRGQLPAPPIKAESPIDQLLRLLKTTKYYPHCLFCGQYVEEVEAVSLLASNSELNIAFKIKCHGQSLTFYPRVGINAIDQLQKLTVFNPALKLLDWINNGKKV